MRKHVWTADGKTIRLNFNSIVCEWTCSVCGSLILVSRSTIKDVQHKFNEPDLADLRRYNINEDCYAEVARRVMEL